jgi:sugar phosphate permease
MKFPASLAGLGTLPLPVCFAIGARFSSRAVGRVGARRLVISGFLIMAAGLLWLARIPIGASYLTAVLPGLVLRGLGQGISVVPTMVTVTSGVPDGEHGIAAGLYNTSQQLGGALGVAAIASVAGAVESAHAGTRLTAEAYGIRAGFAVAAGLAVLGSLVALALPRGSPRTAAPTAASSSTVTPR